MHKTPSTLLLSIFLISVVFFLGGCQSQTEDVPVAEETGLELLDFIHQSITELQKHVGDIVGIESDEMDGTPMVVFDDLKARCNAKEEEVTGFILSREMQIDLRKYRVAGVHFDMDNLQVLETLGTPVNGNRQVLNYSKDYLLWWKFTFDSEDQMQYIQVFYGKDQGDRSFVDWRKS